MGFISVDVVALYQIGKRPVPLRFRFVDERGDDTVVKVEKILSVEGDLSDKRDPMFIYRCRSIVGGVSREYKLGYRAMKNEWHLKL